jgi:hypothetical protein
MTTLPWLSVPLERPQRVYAHLMSRDPEERERLRGLTDDRHDAVGRVALGFELSRLWRRMGRFHLRTAGRLHGFQALGSSK